MTKTCRYCGQPGELRPTGERRAMLCISVSNSMNSTEPAKKLRTCAVVERADVCYFHSKVERGLFGEQARKNLEKQRVWK